MCKGVPNSVTIAGIGAVLWGLISLLVVGLPPIFFPRAIPNPSLRPMGENIPALRMVIVPIVVRVVIPSTVLSPPRLPLATIVFTLAAAKLIRFIRIKSFHWCNRGC